MLLLIFTVGNATTSTAGLPFTEDFSSQALMDKSQTTANWSTVEKNVALAWRAQRLNRLPNGAQTGIGIGSDDDITYALVFGDVDGDGDLDILSGNRGQTNTLAFNDGTVFFNSSVTIGSDTDDTRSLTLGDVDGDGDLDVIAGNNNQTNKLYLNNGVNPNGTFRGFTSGVAISSDTDFTRFITLGDVDGDGDLDVLAGNYQQSNKLYLNDGIGNFVRGGDFGNDTTITSSLTLGDVDRDGDLDVLAGNDGATNKLYLNNGVDSDGKFAGFASGMDISTETDNTFSLTLGDVDSDGDLDVLSGNFRQTNKFYLNDGVDSDGTFRGFANGVAISSDTNDTYSVALGDADGDGDLDAVIGNKGQTNRLYLNDGNGAYAIGVAIGSEDDSTLSIAIADVDGDGDLDVLAGNSNIANKLYLNDVGRGGFALGLAISTDVDITASITLGDIDGDGDLDLLAGNVGQTNKLYLNNGSGGFVDVLDIGSDTDDTLLLILGDVDGDGDLDVLAGNNEQTNKLYLNEGVGTEGTLRGFASGVDIGSETDDTVSLTLGDLDGDGDLDVLAGNVGTTNKLYLNDGSGAFSTTGLHVGSGEADLTVSIILVDVDGDGNLDVLTGNRAQTNKLYLNNGSGALSPFSPRGFEIGIDPKFTTSLAIGDVDGDGDLDLLTGNEGQTNELYLNNGVDSEGTFRGFAVGVDISSDAAKTFSLTLGDVDGDGDLDVVAGNRGLTNKLYLNDGSGTFSATGQDIGIQTNDTRAIILGDVDGDGDLDMLAGNNGTNMLYRNDSHSGAFSAAGQDIGSELDSTNIVTLGDVDGDGDLDMLAGNNGTNMLYLNVGGGFADGVAFNTDTDTTYSLTLGDMDGDGDLDVLAGNNGQTNKLYLNDGIGGFAASVDISSDTDATFSLTLGDVDGDGDLDVLTGNEDQTNMLYINEGAGADGTFRGFASGVDIGSETDKTYSLSLRDMDGDGYLDAVVGNWGQTNKLYLNNGVDSQGTFGGFADSVDISSDTDATFSLTLGDVDGDGDLDVLAGNQGDALDVESIIFGQTSKLYLNDGSGSFNVTGQAIGSEMALSSIILGDVDSDGDLDILAGNYSQTNKLFLNDGNGVFADTLTLGSERDRTSSLALGDVDGDGDLDVVVGNTGANKLYRLVSYMTHAGQVVSSKINDTNLRSVRLDTTQTSNTPTTRNTSIDYYLSNNGGSQWHLVKPGEVFTFPDFGTKDLRWKAQLQSLSPFLTPLLSSIVITQIDTDNDGLPDECDEVCIASGGVADTDDDNDGIADKDDAFPLISSVNLVDTDRDGAPNECDDACQLLGMSADEDDDNDGIADEYDLFPLIALDDVIEGDFTRALILGDVDGDGDLDLLTGNETQTNKLYLNDGSGGFSDTLTLGSDMNSTSSLALGDVDGDGDLDVVVGNRGQTNKLYLNKGIDTNGVFLGFVSGVDIGSDRDETSSIILGDVDGDGDLDVLAGNPAPLDVDAHNFGVASKLYLNDGSGGFSINGLAIGDADYTISLALGDMDSDGDLDLVVGNYGQTNKLYLNDGDGDFASGVAIGSDQDNTSELALGDVDGDGDLDVLAGNDRQTNKLYLNDGDGVFASAVNITSDADNTSSLILGDMDADGDLDVLVGNVGQTNKLYLNDGSGGFANAVVIGSDTDATSSLTVGDVNGDGDLDVLAGNDNLNKLYMAGISGTFFIRDVSARVIDTDNDGAPDECGFACQAFGISADSDDDNDGIADANDAFSLIALDDVGEEGSTTSLILGDIDGDGDMDALAGNYSETNRLYLSSGNGHFASGVDIGSESDKTQSLALGDVNDDGHLDLLVGNDGQSNKLYLNKGVDSDGAFRGFASGAAIGSEKDRTQSIALADVNGDGHLDVLAGNDVDTNKLYLNNGTGSFSVNGQDIDSEVSRTFSITLGDVDGDGDLDLVTGNYSDLSIKKANKLYLNNGAFSGFATGVDIGSDTDKTTSITLGDVNGDGNLDILAGNDGEGIKMYLNNGFDSDDKFWSFESGVTISTDVALFSFSEVALGDVDGDGDLDVLEGNNPLPPKLYINDGSGSFANGVGIGNKDNNPKSDHSIFTFTDYTSSFTFDDVDGDGDLDVLAGNYGQTNKLYLNDGSGEFSEGALVRLIDTDNDGAPNQCDDACLKAGVIADQDDDNDGVADVDDAFPLISIGELTDTDSDGAPDDCDAACLSLGMTADTDDDNDGVLDVDTNTRVLPVWLLKAAKDAQDAKANL